MEEIWRSLKDYEDSYEISSFGNLRSKDRLIKYKDGKEVFTKGKIINGYDNSNGYWYYDIYKDGKRKKESAHRLVAKTFLPNPNNYKCVNHKDENRRNNKVENIEWCSHKYNCNYGSHNEKLSKSLKGKEPWNTKSVICLTTGKVFDKITDAANYYGIPKVRSHISRHCNGSKIRQYVGKLKDGTKLQWMYYEEYLKQKEIKN